MNAENMNFGTDPLVDALDGFAIDFRKAFEDSNRLNRMRDFGEVVAEQVARGENVSILSGFEAGEKAASDERLKDVPLSQQIAAMEAIGENDTTVTGYAVGFYMSKSQPEVSVEERHE
jgi:hypothetical protein